VYAGSSVQAGGEQAAGLAAAQAALREAQSGGRHAREALEAARSDAAALRAANARLEAQAAAALLDRGAERDKVAGLMADSAQVCCAAINACCTCTQNHVAGLMADSAWARPRNGL
jgi:hypothetical protein